MFKCDECDGPRHHVSCLNKQVQANMFCSRNAPICQWCAPFPRHVFTADHVRLARDFVDDFGFPDDPENPNRKERARDLLEFHERRVPPAALSPPEKVPDPVLPNSPSDSDQTTSDGKGASLGAKPSAKEDDAPSEMPKACAEFTVSPGQLVVYNGQFAHVKGTTEMDLLRLAIADPEDGGGTHEGAFPSLGCVDVVDCEEGKRDSAQSKFVQVSPKDCFFPDQITLKGSNRQSTSYGLENFFVMNCPASFRIRTASLDVRFGEKVTCADKFPNRKSFVVAAILVGSTGGRTVLCMEDPACWSAAREDYQHQCETWLCKLGTLTVDKPLQVVKPEFVSLLCRALTSFMKGGTRHVSPFSLPREQTKQLFPMSKVGSDAAVPPVITTTTNRVGVRISERAAAASADRAATAAAALASAASGSAAAPAVRVQKPKAKNTRVRTPKPPKPRASLKAPVPAAPPPINTEEATPLPLLASGASSFCIAPEQQKKAEASEVQEFKNQIAEMASAMKEMASAMKIAAGEPAEVVKATSKPADAAGGNCTPSKERAKKQKSKKSKKKRKAPSPSSSSSSSSGSSGSSGSEEVISPATKQKFANWVNNAKKDKKPTKKNKKKQKKQPVEPAESTAPQHNYYFQGTPSAARPQPEMFNPFNFPAMMQMPNAYYGK